MFRNFGCSQRKNVILVASWNNCCAGTTTCGCAHNRLRPDAVRQPVAGPSAPKRDHARRRAWRSLLRYYCDAVMPLLRALRLRGLKNWNLKFDLFGLFGRIFPQPGLYDRRRQATGDPTTVKLKRGLFSSCEFARTI